MRSGPLVGTTMLLASFGFALLMLAQRFRTLGGGEAALRSPVALMRGALLPLPGMLVGTSALDPSGPFQAEGLLGLGMLLAIAGLWLRNGGSAATRAKAARSLALLALEIPALGLAFTAARGSFEEARTSGVLSLARTLTVFVLGYAILRRQLFDIDVKVERTLKQSTVAAGFVGVFLTWARARPRSSRGAWSLTWASRPRGSSSSCSPRCSARPSASPARLCPACDPPAT